MGDGAAADDLVQEVLVVMLKRLRARRVREPDRLTLFVRCSSAAPAGSWSAACAVEEAGVTATSAATRPCSRRAPSSIRWPDRQRLHECLGALGERERTMLVLTFYSEPAAASIAARLGTSPENARTLLHRAFVRLRDSVRGGVA